MATTFAYDGSGLLETVTAAGVETSFMYDKAGNRTSVANLEMGTTVSGASATFVHSALGEMLERRGARGTTTYAYDLLGRLKRRDDPDGAVARWSWDPANGKGLPGMRSYGAGFSETYAYNGDARLETATTRIVAGGRTERFDTTYGYDGHGRLLSVTHHAGHGRPRRRCCRVWRSDWRQRWDSRRERWVFENHGCLGMADAVDPVQHDGSCLLAVRRRGGGSRVGARRAELDGSGPGRGGVGPRRCTTTTTADC